MRLTFDDAVTIVRALAAVMVVIVARYVIPIVREYLGDARYDRLVRTVSEAVRCAEQIYTTDQWEKKKEYVIQCALEWLEQNAGVSMSHKEINTLIEAIVYEIKHEGKLEEVISCERQGQGLS